MLGDCATRMATNLMATAEQQLADVKQMCTEDEFETRLDATLRTVTAMLEMCNNLTSLSNEVRASLAACSIVTCEGLQTSVSGVNSERGLQHQDHVTTIAKLAMQKATLLLDTWNADA